MLYAKDFRRIARESLKGNWFLAVLVCLVAGFLGANPVFSSGGGNTNWNLKEESFGAIQNGTIFDEIINDSIFFCINPHQINGIILFFGWREKIIIIQSSDYRQEKQNM